MQPATSREASKEAATDTTPTTMEEVTSITPAASIEDSKEVSTITNPNSNKKVTTIFIMKKAKAKVTMSKRPGKKCQV